MKCQRTLNFKKIYANRFLKTSKSVPIIEDESELFEDTIEVKSYQERII